MQTYSSKSTAKRGLIRMGVPADEAAKIVERDAKVGGTVEIDVDQIKADLAQIAGRAHQQVSDHVAQLSDEDKRQIADEARIRKVQARDVDQDEIDNDLVQFCGYSECPHCGIHLSNGVTDFDGVVDSRGSEREALKVMKHEFACLGCNGEWGKEIKPTSKKRGEPLRHYTSKSTVDGAVAKAHAIFDANPEMRRKDAIAAAVEAGIAFYTARTQYQRWFTARKTAKRGR